MHSWSIKGGHAGTQCGIIADGKALVFDGAGPRQACTPYFNAEDIGSARFFLGIGTFVCTVFIKICFYTDTGICEHTYKNNFTY